MPDAGKAIDFPPSRFTRAVRFLNSILYPDLEVKAGADESERKRIREKRKKEFLTAQRRFDGMEKKNVSGSEEYKREEARFLRARDTFERSEKKLRDHRLKRALVIGHLDLEPYEIRSFSNTVFILLLLLMIFAAVIMIWLWEFNLAAVIFCVLLVILVPGLVALYIDEYPFIRAKRMRALTVGRMPEAIHYLSLSMRLTPSLDRAVKYASSGLSEPLASDLRKVLWDVYMREYSSIEEAFIAFAHSWSEWDEDFKRSLYMVRSAALERDQDGIDRVLDKANQIIIEGTKSKLEEFSNALRIPTLVLFVVGIMLPLLLVIILPIIGISDRWRWYVVLGIDMVLPAIIGIYTYHILGKRPELVSPPDIPPPHRASFRVLVAFLCLLLSGGLLAATVILWPSIIALLLLPWALGLPMAIYCYVTSYSAMKKSRAIRSMEDEYPEALFQLGNRIAEGKPFERALTMTADTMKNTLISKLFQKINYNLQVTRSNLKKILFGASGLLVNSPARVVKSTMHTVVEASSKDPRTAGRTIMQISNYLSDLKRVEKELKDKLQEVTGMMVQTAVFIAPLVMGVTVILYHILSSQLQSYEMPADMNVDLGSLGQDTISPAIMSAALGIYLLELVFVVGLFVARINFGRDDLELKNTLAVYLVVALMSYTLSVLLSYVIIAGFISNLPPVSGFLIG